jgi:putative addiction module component (TIGR02574 family)
MCMRLVYNRRMTTVQEILYAAQMLPVGERAELIHALWDTMAPEDWPPPDAQWIAEAQRRSEEFDAGRMTASPWAEVRQRARRKAGLDG